MKRFKSGIFALAIVLISASAAVAAGDGAAAGSIDLGRAIILAAIYFGAAVAIGIGVFGPALAQGRAVQGAVEGMARNPGIAGKITTTMIIGLAMMESLAIYALVIALLLIFVGVPNFL
ncbi:MAG: ATP synthase F0 subunit C [Thermodesulfobacteriota bacterium]